MDKIHVELDACNAAMAAYLGTDRPDTAWKLDPVYSDLWDSEYKQMWELLTGVVDKSSPF